MTAKTSSTVQDMYPLSPLQQGMLFHALLDPESPAYQEQIVMTLAGELDAAAMRQAWQTVIDRNAILRTAIVSDGLKKPLQVVHREAALHIEEADWRGLSADEQESRMAELLSTMRIGDLTRAPLMRVAIARTADDEYRVAWTHHHILLDGWSMPLILGEVFAAYAAHAAGRRPMLPPRRPYRDYIAWLQQQDLGAAERYWRGAVGDVTEPTTLSIRRGATAGGAATHAAAERHLPEELAQKLQSLARDRQLTPSSVLQGLWAILLGRYAATRDVVFGTTVSGRPAALKGVEEMIGLFINTVPARFRVDEEAPLAEWLRGVQKEQFEAREFEYVPLYDVQRWSGVPAGTPLFDSLFVFENYPAPAGGGKGGALRLVSFDSVEQTNFPLTCVAGIRGVLVLRVQYDARSFDAESIERLLEHFTRLIDQAIANPETRIADLRILDDAEREQLLVGFNQTASEFPREATLAELFEAQAAKTPDAIAVTYDGVSLTYAELNARANAVARELVARGIGADDLGGLFMERSLEMVVATLAIVKAGGAYLPLDVTYPRERLAFMLADTAARVVVTHSAMREALPAEVAEVVCIDIALPHSTENLGVRTSAGNLAYVIYTSGSTGVPKGIGIPQSAVTRLVINTNFVAVQADDRIAQASNVSFDAATFEIWGALLNGARLVGVSRETMLSPARFGAAIREEGITTLFLTTALFNQIAQEEPEAFHGLRHLLFGGEAVEPRWVARVLEHGFEGQIGRAHV